MLQSTFYFPLFQLRAAYQTGSSPKRMDDTVTATIGVLDILIAQASSTGVGTVARILNTAKEDLVYWAVKMNFHETPQEKFINRLLYQNGLFAAADFLKSLAQLQNKDILTSVLESNKLETPAFTAAENMR